MFEIINIIIIGYVLYTGYAALENIAKENTKRDEKIKEGWIDYRTKSAF